MPKRFDEADLSAIRPIPIATRASRVRVEDIVDPRSLTGDSSERLDTRVLQVIDRFNADRFPTHVGQQMDVFIEAPPISEITSKKPGVPNPLARSSIVEPSS